MSLFPLTMFPDNIPVHDMVCVAAGVCLFAAASFFQHKSMITFAELRSGEKGLTLPYVAP